MLGNFQVQRGRALANAAGGVVVGPVTRAVVAAVLARVGYRDAAEVRADAEADEPGGVLDAGLVRLRVSESGHVDGALLVDLLRRPVTDEQRLAAPLEDHVLACVRRKQTV